MSHTSLTSVFYNDLYILIKEYIMVEITDAARDKIKEALDQNAGKYLRIFVEGTG
jgi:hypothetical protein